MWLKHLVGTGNLLIGVLVCTWTSLQSTITINYNVIFLHISGRVKQCGKEYIFGSTLINNFFKF